MWVELGLSCISWIHHLNCTSHCIVLFIDTIEKNAFRDCLVYFSAISRYVFVSLWQILSVLAFLRETHQYHVTGFH